MIRQPGAQGSLNDVRKTYTLFGHMNTNINAIPTRVLARMRRDAGKVHTSKDFLDLGARTAVDKALTRLAKNKTILRIARGLYHLPRTNPRFGIDLAPDM